MASTCRSRCCRSIHSCGAAARPSSSPIAAAAEEEEGAGTGRREARRSFHSRRASDSRARSTKACISEA